MKKSTVKSAALMVLASGFLFAPFGCLGNIVSAGLRQLPGNILGELLIDSDAVFDLFGDSNDGTETL